MKYTNSELRKILHEAIYDWNNQIVLILDEDNEIATYRLTDYLTFEIVSSGLLIEDSIYGSIIRSLSELESIIIININSTYCTRIDLWEN